MGTLHTLFLIENAGGPYPSSIKESTITQARYSKIRDNHPSNLVHFITKTVSRQ